MFNFHVPEDRIARFPKSVRSTSNLLCVQKKSDQHAHRFSLQNKKFNQLPDILSKGDVLVINNSKVVKARLYMQKKTGANIEILFERELARTHDGIKQALALTKSNAPIAVNTDIFHQQGGFTLRVGDYFQDGLRYVYLLDDRYSWMQVLEKYGHVPLPPYMHRAANITDEHRYQTIFASQEGSIAAPTAGLHFDEQLVQRLHQKGIDIAEITLHVGYGTFAKVTQDVTQLHAERYMIDDKAIQAICRAKQKGTRVIAVGTTSMRVLESIARLQDTNTTSWRCLQPMSGETQLCIKPGFVFRIADGLITNFHLPQTSLLWLVCAFAGIENTRSAYAYALEHAYQFYSYGDAMLIV